MVESWRNDAERINMMYWQLTCASYYAVYEWEWLYREWGYTGDYSELVNKNWTRNSEN